MNWERFFFYLNRVNAVLIFLAVCLFVFFAVRDSLRYRGWEHNATPYGEQGLAGEAMFAGEELEVAGGLVVRYRVEGEDEFSEHVVGSNISLTDMTTGKSRLVLPQGSDKLVLNWEVLKTGDGSDRAVAYSALVGTRKDYAEGRLDLVVGRLSDLEQKTIAERVRFVDSPRALDAETLSMIIWPEANEANFVLLDLRTLSVVMQRDVALPLPDTLRPVEAGGPKDAPVNQLGEPFQ